MSNTKNTQFSIGQFADLHGINKKTLMWYDKVNLFKPAVVGENGYRYYTYDQSSTLETILMLRELNVSIPEIKKFMENRSAVNLKELLEGKVGELDTTIAQLKTVRKALVRQKSEIASLLDLDLSEISIIEKEKQYLAVVNTERDASLETEIGMVLDEAKKHQLHRLQDISYGSMISVDSLYRGDFDDYAALFMDIPNPPSRKGFHVRPKGRYLTAYCKGSWDKIPSRYKVMLAYAKKNHLEFCGYAYETGINETMIDSVDDYITQIEIPIHT